MNRHKYLTETHLGHISDPDKLLRRRDKMPPAFPRKADSTGLPATIQQGWATTVTQSL